MNVKVLSLKGEPKGEISLARAGSEPLRNDIINKAFLAERSRLRQPYGADPLAGQRTSAHYHGERGIRHSMMNKEMARMKRIHSGGFLYFRAREVPQAVKGRKTFPPSTDKVWELKINKKERRKAISSAVSASLNRDMVAKRGHKIGTVPHFPIVVEDALEGLRKSRELEQALLSMGLKPEMERIEAKSIRGTAGSMRGRRYIRKKGPLIIISRDGGIVKAGKNLQGVDVLGIKELSVNQLAPGCHPGRLCVWTKSALEKFDKGEW